MSKWTSTPLKKIGRIVTGKTPPTNNPANYGDGYMFVTPVELHDTFIINSAAKSITEQGFSTVKSNSLNGFSICVGCIGWDMGNVALVDRPCVTNQQINSITDIDEKAYNPYYIYYWLTLQKQMLFQIANVTRTPILNKSTFEDVLVPIPEKSIQDRITSVLLPISRKIALNNRINAELERTARMVYEYMFLQGGRETCKLGDIIQPKRVPFVGEDKSGILGMDLSIMPSDSFCLNQKGNAEDFTSNQFVMSKYDLLFGSIRPYLKKAGFAPFDGLANGTILNFRPKRAEDFAFALCALTSEEIFQYAITRSNGNGTRMPTIGSDEILDFTVSYDKEAAVKFGEQLTSYWQLIANNINENFALAEQRDFLLPLLMNGQVRVGRA